MIIEGYLFTHFQIFFMKHFSHSSIICGIGYLLVFILCVNCKKDYSSTDPSQLSHESITQQGSGNTAATGSILSQTRTANYFHNTYGNGTNLTDYVQWGAQYVAGDDNSYAYTAKINKLQRVYLILQDFRFEIPSNVIIESISVKIRRFKSGQGQVKDCFVHLRTTNLAGGLRDYGPEMANTISLWPTIETEASYSQTGTGNNGIVNSETHTIGPYQWTPALINHSSFGLYLLTDFPKKGFYYAYFDKVEITVEYSLP